MKIGRIRAACKAAKRCMLLIDGESSEQWIGNGRAFWRVEGMWIEEAELSALMDATAKEWEEWAVDVIHRGAGTEELFRMLADTFQEETEVQPGEISILYGKTEWIYFCETGGCRAVAWAIKDDFNPIKEAGEQIPRYLLRRGSNGKVIAYVTGLICRGAATVSPGGWIEDGLCRLLGR